VARLALGELAADGADGYGKVLADERDRARKIEGGAAKLRTGSKLLWPRRHHVATKTVTVYNQPG